MTSMSRNKSGALRKSEAEVKAEYMRVRAGS